MRVTMLQEIRSEPYVERGIVRPTGDAIADSQDVAATVASFATVALVEAAKGWGPYDCVIVTTDQDGDAQYWLAAVADDEGDHTFDRLIGMFNVSARRDGRQSVFIAGRVTVTVSDTGVTDIAIEPQLPWGEAPTLHFTRSATLGGVLDAVADAIAYPPDTDDGPVIFAPAPK